MRFSYAKDIRDDFPQLATGLLRIDGVAPGVDVAAWTARFAAVAGDRLDREAESAFPEIQAWRRGYARMGLKPTQYRSAAEALLRRFRMDKALPSIHPLVDLCNAVSIAFAIPIAVFDVARIAGDLQVRRAKGTERYENFSGDVEHPETGEVIFADTAGRVHARRWVNRQSGYSAVRAETTQALVVAEALHETAAADVARLVATITSAIAEIWPAATTASERPGPAI